MAEPDWAKDGRFDDAAGRLINQDEIERMLSKWRELRSPKAVTDTLLAEGVPADVVQRSSDLQQDSRLKHRGFFRNLDHQEMGTVPYPGHQFRIPGYDSGPRSSAPVLGQYNEYVLKEILGMTDKEMVEAVVAGPLRRAL